jgi:hypothetical protein
MLASQSSYALMEPSRREELVDAIGGLIDNQLGGTVNKEYFTVLAVAGRRLDAMAGEVVVAVKNPAAATWPPCWQRMCSGPAR